MSKVQFVTSGTSRNLDAHIPYSPDTTHTFRAPIGYELTGIVAIAIAGSDDHVYTWFVDGKVSEGTSRSFAHYEAPHPYTLPPGKDVGDIVGIAIAGSNDHVYTWFADGTYSIGTSIDLDAYAAPKPYTLPPGKTPADVVSIAIAGSDDHVYTWFTDGTVSEGRSHDLDHYEAPKSFAVPAGLDIDDIVSIAIAGSNDHVYTWYKKRVDGLAPASMAKKIDQAVLAFMDEHRITGMTVAVARHGRCIVSRGYGYASFGDNRAMTRKTRSRIGSVSKMIAAFSWMRLTEQKPEYSEETKVYGPAGVLKHSSYMTEAYKGLLRFSPIVGMAIARSNDRVYTWLDNGKVSSGTSRDLDKHSSPQPYELPEGKQPRDIRAIAFGPLDHVHVWYDDGSYSRGTPQKLHAHQYVEFQDNDPDTPQNEKSGYHDGKLLGILGKAIVGPDVHVYTWYDDGTVRVGTLLNPEEHSKNETMTFSVPPGKSRYDIRAIAVADSSDHVYTWFTDGTMSVGTPLELGKYSTNTYSLPSGIVPNYVPLSWYQSMKVAHLMTHSAGFIGSGDMGGAAAMFDVPEDDLTYEQVHKYMLRTRKLQFAPGSRSSYSNHGMGLVGHLVSVASKQPYHEYAKQHVLAPATVADPEEGIVPRDLITGSFDSAVHDDKTDAGIVTSPPNPLGKVTPELNAGGWVASAESFVRLLLATDRRNPQPDILKPSTLQKMERPYFPTIEEYGLGWRLKLGGDATVKVAHGGDVGSGKAYVAKLFSGEEIEGVSAHGFSIALCTNIEAPKKSSMLIGLANDILSFVATHAIPLGYDIFAEEEPVRRSA